MNAIVVKGREHRYCVLLVIALHVSGSYIQTGVWQDFLDCSSEMRPPPRTYSPAVAERTAAEQNQHFTKWKRRSHGELYRFPNDVRWACMFLAAIEGLCLEGKGRTLFANLSLSGSGLSQGVWRSCNRHHSRERLPDVAQEQGEFTSCASVVFSRGICSFSPSQFARASDGRRLRKAQTPHQTSPSDLSTILPMSTFHQKTLTPS